METFPYTPPPSWVYPRTPKTNTNNCPQGFWCTSSLFFSPPPPLFDPPDSSSSSTLSPLVIAIIAILVSALLLLVYYAFISRYFTTSHRNSRDLEEGQAGDHHHPRASNVDLPRSDTWQEGLDDHVIKSIAVCRYKKGDGFVEGTECPVCLGEFRDDEEVRLLPRCCHAFHVECIDTWLKSHTNCPLCRANVPPVAVEVVMGLMEESGGVVEEVRRSKWGGDGGGGRSTVVVMGLVDGPEVVKVWRWSSGNGSSSLPVGIRPSVSNNSAVSGSESSDIHPTD